MALAFSPLFRIGDDDRKIDVCVLKVMDPSHYIIKKVQVADQSLDHSSEQIRLEEMNSYFTRFMTEMLSIKDLSSGMLVAMYDSKKKKWCRAKIDFMIQRTQGIAVRAYLVDYAEDVAIPLEFVRKLDEKWVKIPFQAFHFKLLGLLPKSKRFTLTVDLAVEEQAVETWDFSAVDYVTRLIKNRSLKAEIKVRDQEGNAYGFLYVCNPEVCVNEDLLEKDFAYMSNEKAKEVLQSGYGPRCLLNSPEEMDVACDTLEHVSELCSQKKVKLKDELETMWTTLNTKANSSALQKNSQEKMFLQHSPKSREQQCSESLSLVEGVDSPSPSLQLSPFMKESAWSRETHHPQEVNCQQRSNKRSNLLKTLHQNLKADKEAKTESPVASSCLPQVLSKLNNIHECPQSTPKLLLKLQYKEPNFKQLSPTSMSENQNVKKVDHSGMKKLIPVGFQGELPSPCSPTFENKIPSTSDSFSSKYKRSPSSVSSDIKIATKNVMKIKPESSDTNTGLSTCTVKTKETNSTGAFPEPVFCLSKKLCPLQAQDNVPSSNSLNYPAFQNFLPHTSGLSSSDRHKSITDVSTVNCNLDITNFSRSSSLQHNEATLSATSKAPKFDMQSLLNVFSKRRDSTSPVQKTVSIEVVTNEPANDDKQNLSGFVNTNKVDKSRLSREVGCNAESIEIESMSPKCTQKFDVQSLLNINRKRDSATSPVQHTVSSELLTNQPANDSKQNLSSFNNTNKVNESRSSGCNSEFVESVSGNVQVPVKKFVVNSADKSDTVDKYNDYLIESDCSEKDKSDNEEVDKLDIHSFIANRYIETVPPRMDDILPVMSFDSLSPANMPIVPRESSEIPYLSRNLGKIDESCIISALCHGPPNSPIPKPILRLSQAPLNKVLKKWLEDLSFIGPSTIQTVAWPAVFRGHNMVIVSPPHAGKTLTYLIPLISELEQTVKYSELPEGHNPRVLVLCSSWKSAQYVYNQSQMLIGERGSPKVTLMYGDGQESKRMLKVLDTCDILITTPCCFLRVLNYFEYALRLMRRMCHLILDDGDVVLEKYAPEVVRIMEAYTSAVCDRHVRQSQLIVCSPRWIQRIESFARCYMNNPHVYITSFYEAAIYARVPNYVNYYLMPHAKISKLTDLLGTMRNYKTVVCISSASQALPLKELISAEGIFCLLAHENMDHCEIKDVCKKWYNSGNQVTLIVSDPVLLELNVRDATCLIHFDIPDDSRLKFGNRFKCISDHFNNVLGISKADAAAKSSTCVSHLFVSQEYKKQALKLVDFLERLKIPISGLKPLKKLAEDYTQEVKENPLKELCEFVKAYGKCSNVSSCSSRHTIYSESDQPKLPWKGFVKMLITNVASASKFWVQVLAFKNEEAEAWTTVDKCSDLKTKMESYYVEKNTCKTPETVSLFEVYALEKGGSFHRVQVQKLLNTGIGVVHEKARVRFIDEGHTSVVRRMELLILPQELKFIEAQAIQMYMCDVSPIDNDDTWTIQAGTYVDELIGGRIVVGKIRLCLGSTLWVNPLTIQQKLESINVAVNLLNVNRQLIAEGFAQPNPNHLVLLYKLCEGKIEIPKHTSRGVPLVQHVPHAFLGMETEELVYVSIVIRPSLFYVQKQSCTSCLEDLEKEVNVMVAKKKLKPLKKVFDEMLCLAPLNEEERWYRGAVKKYDEVNKVAEVFFVDYGDTGMVDIKRMYKILPKHLLLPMQAIECSLADVSPSDASSEALADALVDLTRTNDLLNEMQIKVVSKKTATTTSGNHYEVHLHTLTGDSIAKKLQKFSHAASDTQPDQVVAETCGDDTGRGSSPSLSEAYVDDEDCQRAFFESVMQKLNFVDNPESSDDGIVEELRNPSARSFDKSHWSPERHSNLAQLVHSSGAVTKSEPKCSEACPKPYPAREKVHRTEDSTELVQSKVDMTKKPNPFLSLLKVLNSKSRSVDRPTPQIKWRQQKRWVIASVNVANVKECDVKFGPKHLTFSTSVGSQAFYFSEELYDNICPDKSRYVIKYSHVLITMEKKNVGEKWKNLFLEKKPLVKPDFEHLDSSSDESTDEDISKKQSVYTSYKQKKKDVCPIDFEDLECSGDSSESEEVDIL